MLLADEVRIAPVHHCGTYTLCSRARERSRPTAMNIMSTLWTCQNILMMDITLSNVSEIVSDNRLFCFPKVGMGRTVFYLCHDTTPMLQTTLLISQSRDQSPTKPLSLPCANMDTTPTSCESNGSIAIFHCPSPAEEYYLLHTIMQVGCGCPSRLEYSREGKYGPSTQSRETERWSPETIVASQEANPCSITKWFHKLQVHFS